MASQGIEGQEDGVEQENYAAHPYAEFAAAEEGVPGVVEKDADVGDGDVEGVAVQVLE